MENVRLEFQVQNVKCNGCASTLCDGLGKDSRVKEVTVDVPKGLVTVVATEDIQTDLRMALKNLGFPEKTG